MIDASVVGRISAMMPFLEAVTYFSKQAMPGNAESGYTRYAITRVRPRKVNLKDVAADPALLARVEKVFEIYADALTQATGTPPVNGGMVPRKSDYLTEPSGKSWLVVHVDSAMNQGVFHCYCIEKD